VQGVAGIDYNSRMNVADLAARIDHSVLKPETSLADVDRAVEEAVAHRFATVCVAPPFVAHVARRLRGSGVRTCSVIGFPSGAHKAIVKAIEATSAVKDGADEIDVVAHLPNLLALDLPAARAELLEVVRGARAVRPDVVVKVIVETAALMAINAGRAEETIALACRAVRESGCDFIKTSSGFHPAGGATVEAVTLLKRHGEGLLVKASGGIRTLEAARAMLDAGADRLGLSASVSILAAAAAL
jgi:deoxyribose-phosphate aldolase